MKVKRALIFILVIFVLTMNSYAVTPNIQTSYTNRYQDGVVAAAKLKSLGLFKGVSETEYDLNRPATRADAIVMLVRLLGEEKQVFTYRYTHPFNDVPEWANPYVGYAYSKGYTNGITENVYGSNDDATAEMYFTFVLRALGYKDGEGSDFTWNSPFELAGKVNILSSYDEKKPFLRADVALVSYSALSARIKDTDYTLITKLYDLDAVSIDRIYANDFEDILSGSKKTAFKKVTVDTVDSLVKAIASDTIIELKAGTYNLTQANWTSIDNANVNYSLANEYVDEPDRELVIKDINHCIIIGEDAENTEIISEHALSNVLAFEKCQHIAIKNIKIGHQIEEPYCSGNVLHFAYSEYISVVDSILYGCGTNGIQTEYSDQLYVENTIIKECTEGGLSLIGSNYVIVLSSKLFDNIQYQTIQMLAVMGVEIIDTSIYNNNSGFGTAYPQFASNFDIRDSNNVKFSLSDIYDNSSSNALILVNNNSNINFEHCNFTNNKCVDFIVYSYEIEGLPQLVKINGDEYFAIQD